MTLKEKAKVMHELSCNFDRIKYGLDECAEHLESHGMNADAESLMKMVYRVEAMQNKYRDEMIRRGKG